MTETVSAESADIPADTAMVHDPRNEAGAVKRGAGTGTAPDIRVSEILFGFLHHGGKLRVGKGFRRDFILFVFGVDIGVYIGRIGEQVRAVAQRTHIGCIH